MFIAASLILPVATVAFAVGSFFIIGAFGACK